jgi:YbaB/EbfC DNA-binding family protein
MTVTGSARGDGVSVEVLPGGALHSLELTPEALRAGGAALSRTILALVRRSAAQANQRAKSAVADDVDGLRPEELAGLGLTQEESLTEAAERTTPDSWKA